MKKVHLLIVLLFAFSVSMIAQNGKRDIEHELDMMGELLSPEAKSGTTETTTVARVFQESSQIRVTVSQNLGALTLLISNQNGIPVYAQGLNTATQAEWTLNLSSLKVGYYKIELVNTQQKRLTGYFTIE